MADSLGDKKLEPTTEKPAQVDSNYTVISYHSNQLPQEFRNLIIAPFLNSLRYGNDWFKLIDKDSYYTAYSKFIDLLLKRDAGIIRLAVLNDNTVLGWSLVEGNTLHYVWVKKEVRMHGIAGALVPKEIESVSHMTNKGLNIWNSKMPHVRFNPFV